MSHSKPIILLICCVLLSAFSLAEPLSNYNAEIRVVANRGINLKANGTMSFTGNGSQWSLEMTAKSSLVNSRDYSQGTLIESKYYPVEFTRNVKAFFLKEQITWQYDWQANRVWGKVDNDDYQYDLTGLIHDQISFQMPMRQGLKEGKTSFEFSFLAYNRPKTLTFEVIGEELLSLPEGRTHTLILKQTAPLGRDEKKLIWFSTEHDYIPVRFATFKKDKLKDDITVAKLWIDDEIVQFRR